MVSLELVSCKHGLGVITRRAIGPGEVVIQFEGPLLGRQALPKPYTPDNDYFLQIGPDKFLGPSGGLDDFINHSCDPNTGLQFDMDSIWLVAIKEIPADAEITFDYSTTMQSFGFEMACSCGANCCRQKVRDFADIPIEIQQKYISMGVVPDYILGSAPCEFRSSL